MYYVLPAAGSFVRTPRRQSPNRLWFVCWVKAPQVWVYMDFQLEELAKLEPKARKDPKGPQIAENMGENPNSREHMRENSGLEPGGDRFQKL